MTWLSGPGVGDDDGERVALDRQQWETVMAAMDGDASRRDG